MTPAVTPAPSAGRAWDVLLPEGTVQLRLSPGGGVGGGMRAALAALPAGTPVALLDGRWGSRRRLRRAAARAGVVLTREYVLLPGLASAAFVVEDRPGPVGWVWGHLATVPPGRARGAAAVDLAVRAGRRAPASALGRVAPGRLAVGRTR